MQQNCNNNKVALMWGMLFARRQVTPPTGPTLATILHPDVNVVSVPRSLDPWMKMRLDALVDQASFSHAARLDTVTPDVSSLVRSIHDKAVKAFLVSDIRLLAGQLGTLLGCRYVQARLYVQRSDGCRKIHADNVSVRVICTYVGPGTEWLPNQDLVRRHLGASHVDLKTANRLVLRPGAAVRQCEPFEVLLLKGNAHPGNRGRGAAHRSPPLEASGAARLVLKIDEHSGSS